MYVKYFTWVHESSSRKSLPRETSCFGCCRCQSIHTLSTCDQTATSSLVFALRLSCVLSVYSHGLLLYSYGPLHTDCTFLDTPIYDLRNTDHSGTPRFDAQCSSQSKRSNETISQGTFDIEIRCDIRIRLTCLGDTTHFVCADAVQGTCRRSWNQCGRTSQSR